MTPASHFDAHVRRDLDVWVAEVVAVAVTEVSSQVSQIGAMEVLAVLQRQPAVVAQAYAGALKALMDEPQSRSHTATATTASAPSASSSSLISLTFDVPATPAKEPSEFGLLSLIPDKQIDDDIETASIIDAIEASTERELRRLVNLFGKMSGAARTDVDQLPLSPTHCARALQNILDQFDLPPPARRLMHRQLGKALAQRLRAVYSAQCDTLRLLGVHGDTSPVRSPTPAAFGNDLRRRDEVDDETPAVEDASLGRLVTWSQQAAPASAPDVGASETPPAIRFLAEPLATRSTGAARTLDKSAAQFAMNALFEQLSQQAWLSEESRQTINALRLPASTIAVSDPDLWNALDHPWWQLIDRLVAIGTVHDARRDKTSHLVSRSLERIIDRLSSAKVINRAVCATAVAAVDRISREGLLLRAEQLHQEVDALESAARRESLEVELTDYVEQQLRTHPAPPEIGRLLTGPLVKSMTAVALDSAAGEAALGEMAQLIDDLLHAAAQYKQPAPAPWRQALCNRTRVALTTGGCQGDALEAAVTTLAAILAAPPAPTAGSARPGPGPDPTTTGTVARGRAALPTVPVDIVTTIEPTKATLDRRTWIESLEAGAYCHAFLRQRWVNTQLIWHSEGRTLFVFSSREGGPSYTLTRRGLEKLRNAGLATTIQDGQLLAQAMESVADSGSGAEFV